MLDYIVDQAKYTISKEDTQNFEIWLSQKK